MKEKTADIDILEELKEFFDKMDYEAIKHKPEEYIQAISNLIAENKELKEENEKMEELIENSECDMSTNYIRKSKVEVVKEKIMSTLKIGENVPVWKIVMTDSLLQSLLGKE